MEKDLSQIVSWKRISSQAQIWKPKVEALVIVIVVLVSLLSKIKKMDPCNWMQILSLRYAINL